MPSGCSRHRYPASPRKFPGFQQLERARVAVVVVRAGFHSSGRIDDQISIGQRRKVGLRMLARSGHDRREFFGGDRFLRECARRPAAQNCLTKSRGFFGRYGFKMKRARARRRRAGAESNFAPDDAATSSAVTSRDSRCILIRSGYATSFDESGIVSSVNGSSAGDGVADRRCVRARPARSFPRDQCRCLAASRGPDLRKQ